MATVTSFEEQDHPSKSELRQFAELFTPIFLASSDEAKRQAVAALSQCPTVPAAVSLFIGCQPIGIAAAFLASSLAIDDDTLITIARTQGAAHAKAIVRRDSLSPKVIDALVSLRQAKPDRGGIAERSGLADAEALAGALEDDARANAERIEREEMLRREIKQIARHLEHSDTDRLGLRTLSSLQEALLVRFAREREAQQFVKALADTLSASLWLAERILLDLSGQQLAVTLTGIGMNFADSVYILERFYPQLAEQQGTTSRAWRILDHIDPDESHARVEAWRRADGYTYLPTHKQKPERPAEDQHIMRQPASGREPRSTARRSVRSR